MKIAYFSDSFLPSVSGIVASIVNLTKGLSRSRNTILIIAPKKNGFTTNIFKKKNVRIRFMSSLPIFFNPNLRVSSPLTISIYNQLAEFDPDVIHFHTTFLLGAGAIILGKLLKKPVISTFHSYFMEKEYLNSIGIQDKRKFISRTLWAYAKRFYEHSDCVITPTRVVRADLMHHTQIKHVVVIPSPINEEAVRLVSAHEVAQLKAKYTLKSKVILYVGRLSLEKSVDILIKAMPAVLQKYPDSSLFIVGEGPQRKRLKRLAKRLKITPHVIFAGEVGQDKLLGGGFFQAADIFATASPSETQGISIVEAMRFGLPIVGVAKKGVGELVRGVGLLCPPKKPLTMAHHINKILSDPSTATSLSKRSRAEFDSNYTLEAIVKKHRQLYQKVIRSYASS